LTHAHWTLGKQKMAKSTGNVVNPFFALDRFGTDTMRYYMIHDGGIDNDADYDNIHIIERYKKGLQGGLGNLTARITRGKGWDVRRAIERFSGNYKSASPFGQGHAREAAIVEFEQLLVELPQAVNSRMEALRPNLALKGLMDNIYAANAFLQSQAPWDIAAGLKKGELVDNVSSKEDAELQMDYIIFLSTEMLRLAGIMLQPVMPAKAKQLLDMLGIADDRRSFADALLGADKDYGVSRVPQGKGQAGVLFAPLMSDS
ncbi:hypothetical protein KCU60_g19004, partial [Aureobasidium melanogenum]